MNEDTFYSNYYYFNVGEQGKNLCRTSVNNPIVVYSLIILFFILPHPPTSILAGLKKLNLLYHGVLLLCLENTFLYRK